MTFIGNVIDPNDDGEEKKLGRHVFEIPPRIGETIVIADTDDLMVYQVTGIEHWPIPEQPEGADVKSWQRTRAFQNIYVKWVNIVT